MEKTISPGSSSISMVKRRHGGSGPRPNPQVRRHGAGRGQDRTQTALRLEQLLQRCIRSK